MKYYGPEANPQLQSDIAGGRAIAETPTKNAQEEFRAQQAESRQKRRRVSTTY